MSIGEAPIRATREGTFELIVLNVCKATSNIC